MEPPVLFPPWQTRISKADTKISVITLWADDILRRRVRGIVSGEECTNDTFNLISFYLLFDHIFF